ncbi:MAG TPA: tetratricopeptide repeat protein, partial [Pyrinomonadaceae bacterium]|nr:tetratricopeptide repeat protein [Pyrinomonadaceae bacterium]
EENKLNPGRKVVAVLPFAADESLKEEEELSVGLAQVLTRELGKVTQISVLPTFVREAIGNKTAAETLEMGQQVGATHILRGTLHKTANAVEVFAELVNVADGRVVWSEKFNEPIVELPRLQNSISSHVLSALTIELSAAEKQGINKKYTENSEAYQFYLVGRYQLSKRSQENLNKAIQSFTIAQEKDPNFALAYVGLADAYALLYLYQTPPPKDAHQKARENAEKALALDNTLGEAYASLGLIEFYGERNIAQAENFYRKAVELNPSYENAHHWLALALAAQGKEEALTEIKAAKQLVPNSPAIITAAGIVHFYLRQLELAERDAQKALRIDEGTVSALGLLRWVAILQGKYDDALAYQQKEKLFGGGEETVTSLLNLAQVQAARGDRDAALGSLNKVFADANYQKMPEYQAYEVALVYIFLDQKDKAFEFLKEAKKTYRANFIASDPRLDKIRNDSRFQALVSSSG